MFLEVAIDLIALTKLDGRIAYVNPSAIVQLAEPKGADSQYKELPPDVHCVVILPNSYISVRETCAEIRKLFVIEKVQP